MKRGRQGFGQRLRDPRVGARPTKMPGVNASFQGDSILEYGAVNIGLAVALEDGLTLPVLHNADSLPIRQIAERSRELALKARENRLTPTSCPEARFRSPIWGC